MTTQKSETDEERKRLMIEIICVGIVVLVLFEWCFGYFHIFDCPSSVSNMTMSRCIGATKVYPYWGG